MSATDAILQDILDQAKISNTHLATLLRQSAGGSGGGGSGGGGGPLPNIVPQFNLLNKVLSGMNMVGNLVSNVFSSIFRIGGALVGAFTELSEKAFQGTAKFSDLFAAAGKVAGQLPILGGLLETVFGLFQKFVALQFMNNQSILNSHFIHIYKISPLHVL